MFLEFQAQFPVQMTDDISDIALFRIYIIKDKVAFSKLKSKYLAFSLQVGRN